MKLLRRLMIAGLILGVICLLIVLVAGGFVAFMAVVGSDKFSSRATDSTVLDPAGAATGKALVVYNPGLSGVPKNAATLIANDLRTRGYEVVLAGVKSQAAEDVSGYDVIVAGGPIYGGKVSPSIYSYLQSLTPPAKAKVGAFAIGGSTAEPFPSAAWLKTTRLLAAGGDMDSQTARFMTELLK